MIVPGPTSSLRPVIAAFYATFHQSQPGWRKPQFAQTLRDALAANGSSVTSSPRGLDLVIDDQIGVVILPAAQRLTGAVRRRIRQHLANDGAPEVAVIMAFTPSPSLARVDAPRQRPKE